MRDRDVDSDEGLCTLRRYEQRLERRKKTASNRVGAPGLALTAHRARNRGAPGDGQRLPEGSRYRGATTQGLGTASASKTGQRGDHRVWRGVERGAAKTGQRGDHRVRARIGGGE